MCVELPEEAKTERDRKEDNVAMLRMSLYGRRDAAANFQAEVRKFIERIGFGELQGMDLLPTNAQPENNCARR